MTIITLDYDNAKSYASEQEISQMQAEVDRLHLSMEKGECLGNDFLGWLHLPTLTSNSLLADVHGSAKYIRDNADIFICIGIGGSYLGAKAAIEFTRHTFYNQYPSTDRKFPQVYFAGHNISSDYLSDLLDLLTGKNFCLNVISKSGTTTEPAIAFRLLMDVMEKRYGIAGARQRVFVTTDEKRGALKKLADAQGYRTFVIPDNVGGRYSVLTPVGLLPMAVAGIDIDSLLDGARACESTTTSNSSLDRNTAYLYAVLRNLLYSKGKVIEVMASFHHSLAYFMEWWKQLAGESEGKQLGGIFPASVQNTTDLHSMGQWIQEGNRIIFETFLLLGPSRKQILIPRHENDGDGLNFLAEKSLDFVNEKAYKGTAMAHLEGGVPNLSLTIADRSDYALGYLFYFFERAIAMSGYLMKVNPFDQPGVEFYKKNMFVLLNKPGFGKGS